MTEGTIDEFAAAHGLKKRRVPLADQIDRHPDGKQLVETLIRARDDGHTSATLAAWLKAEHGIEIGPTGLERYLRRVG